jgi:putative ABC transport system permease protein
MRHLLRLISLRYLRAAPVRTTLTLFGILLGVSVVFAVDVVNSSVLGSFRTTIDNVAGKTALTVGGAGGVAEELLEVVRAVPGVADAVPVIQESAHDERTDTHLTVMGIDVLSDSKVRDYEVTKDDVKIEDDLEFLNDARSIIVTQKFAKKHNIKVGDTLLLATVAGKHEYTVRGTLAARGPANVFGGDLLLMDVFAAQVAFERGKRFDHIDVVPAKDVDVNALAQRIEKAIDNKAQVNRPQRRTEEAERLTAGFKLGLSLAALVAMFVGGFIVYNALAIAVAQRRREIGILRALGTTRMQIMALFVGEGLALGALGGVLGVGFGLLLARLVLKAVGSSVSVAMQTETDKLLIDPRDLIASVALGVAVAFVAAFFPARKAASTEPAMVMRKQSDGGGIGISKLKTSLTVSGLTFLAAAIMAVIAHYREDYLLGYAVAGVGAFTIAFLSPSIAIVVGNAVRRLLGHRSPTIMLGSVGFVRNAGRNAVAISALGISLANVVNADAFVDSMKYSTSQWFARAARADVFLYIGKQGTPRSQNDQPLPLSLLPELAKIPDVEHVDTYRLRQQSLDGRPYHMATYDLANYFKYNEIPVVEGDMDKALPQIMSGKGVAASESFMRAFKDKKLGDKLALQTPQGLREFEIVLVYVDFTADAGILMTDRNVYRDVWQDNLVDAYGLYLKKGADFEAVRDAISADIGKRHRLIVLSNGQYKQEVFGTIDRTFALTRATEFVAIIVAILGIINTLLVTVMDRRTEIGMLKAIGADSSQVQNMLVTEGALIGLASTFVGVVFGMAFSAYIVKELMRIQVGWNMSWQISPWAIVEIFIAAQLVTFISVWWPMRSADRIDAVEALHYE